MKWKSLSRVQLCDPMDYTQSMKFSRGSSQSTDRTQVKADCQRMDAFEVWCWRRILCPLDSKEIKPFKLKANQPWILIGRTDASWSSNILVICCEKPNHWQSPRWKDWGQEKRASEDELAGWHHWCNGHELGQTLGDAEGQGGLACCSPWGCRVGHDWVTKEQPEK